MGIRQVAAALAVGFAIASVAVAATTAASQPSTPNIIVIVADDLGYADIGAQGQLKDIRTPNIDTIATNGTRFTSGYVSCPVCSPTRAGLMTGRYQQRFGHEFNPGPGEAANFGLPLDQITFPQTLKSAGYATGMVGKWHLGFKPEMHPLQRGFDEFFGFLAGAHPYNGIGRDRNVLMRNTEPMTETDYLTDAFGREAAAFVAKHADADKPFFLYLAFNAVHTPQQASKKYLDRFPDVTDHNRQFLLAKLSAMDDAVGRVLAQVRDHKLEDNTLIFFISDNGGPTAGNGSRNDPLRGFKGQVWEGGVRVPFMVQWKGHIPAGKMIDKPVMSLDIFPTSISVAKATPPKPVKFDGVDLMPLLTADTDKAPHETLCWRFGPLWACRDGNYKMVHTRADGTQLFDLSSDIGEQNDLSAKQPDVLKKVQAKYDEWNAQNVKPLWHDSRDGKNKPGAAGDD